MSTQIKIVSGEGENGTVENYIGKLTVTALRMRLKKEACGGDRWARAEVWVDGELTQQDAEDVLGKNKAASALGKKGGKAKSIAKELSSKANGTKGGRPKKTVPVPPLA